MGWLRPQLTVSQVLAWADAHFARTGRWPLGSEGAVHGADGESWVNLDQALRLGLRGLPRGGTLARLLWEERGARNPKRPPPVTVEQVLAWAEAHRERTGAWPYATSGPVIDAPGEDWGNLDMALLKGRRGLPGGESLARLLARTERKRNRKALPPLSVGLILGWADAHRARTGRYPHGKSGPVAADPGETWLAIDHALRDGLRGLPGGDSLFQLLRRERGARKPGRGNKTKPRAAQQPEGGAR